MKNVSLYLKENFNIKILNRFLRDIRSEMFSSLSKFTRMILAGTQREGRGSQLPECTCCTFRMQTADNQNHSVLRLVSSTCTSGNAISYKQVLAKSAKKDGVKKNSCL